MLTMRTPALLLCLLLLIGCASPYYDVGPIPPPPDPWVPPVPPGPDPNPEPIDPTVPAITRAAAEATVGMSGAEVTEALGNPWRKSTIDDVTIWVYRLDKPEGAVAELRFDTNGIVHEVSLW